MLDSVVAALDSPLGAAFALPHPDALSPLPTACPVRSLVYTDTTHRLPGEMGISSPAVLALSGRGYAELRHYAVLGSPHSRGSIRMDVPDSAYLQQGVITTIS